MSLYKKKSNIHGFGVFSKEIIKKGELIGVFGRSIHTYESMYTIYIDDKPYRANGILKYSNHSNNPNSWVDEDLNMWALKKIKPGIEIVWDYGEEWK